METETIKEKVVEEVKEKATQLAVAKVRDLTLRRQQFKALYHRTKEKIEELDKEIAEVKAEDFEEEALRVVSREEARKNIDDDFGYIFRRALLGA